jgi:hypothetical protein
MPTLHQLLMHISRRNYVKSVLGRRQSLVIDWRSRCPNRERCHFSRPTSTSAFSLLTHLTRKYQLKTSALKAAARLRNRRPKAPDFGMLNGANVSQQMSSTFARFFVLPKRCCSGCVTACAANFATDVRDVCSNSVARIIAAKEGFPGGHRGQRAKKLTFLK